MSHELYKVHRPKTFKQVLGQPDAINILTKFVSRSEIPHCILFTGPSGVGKTTLARIIAGKLECHKTMCNELNTADFRGIEMVRNLREKINLSPLAGRVRVYIIEECHQLTKDAQEGFLKMFEDTPKHVYFLLTTTNPGKLLKAIITRSTEIRLNPLTSKVIQEIITKCYEATYGVGLSEEVRDKITEAADGSARKALVILDQIANIDGEDNQLDAINTSMSDYQGIDLAKALIDFKNKWPDVAKIIKDADFDEEKVRRQVLGYAAAILVKSPVGKMANRAQLIVNSFRDNFFDSGRAGLIAASYEVMSSLGG